MCICPLHLSGLSAEMGEGIKFFVYLVRFGTSSITIVFMTISDYMFLPMVKPPKSPHSFYHVDKEYNG